MATKKMKAGTRVSWLVAGHANRGCGTTIADESDGHVPVAVDHLMGEANPGYHPVIWCTTTWLTPVEKGEAGEPANADAAHLE